jgi:hypothetical protein
MRTVTSVVGGRPLAAGAPVHGRVISSVGRLADSGA